MKKKVRFLVMLGLTVILPVTAIMVLSMCQTPQDQTAQDQTPQDIPSRPEGPCDIYAEGDSPCVAAHSTTRALYASYNGPLYQVMRQSDGKTLDIGVVEPSEGDPGGYADAAAQDEFCANTYCWITTLYDQSGTENHLIQAPRGGTGDPTMMGGFNSLPIADMAPVTLMGHKVYGIFIESGMGLRLNDPVGTAVDDQAQGQYWVVNGHHFNNGCCFNYGNAEIASTDDGDGTMESTHFGNATAWYYGSHPGPWIMTDQENNLVGCVNPDPNDKYCEDLPTITWRFVSATADGEPGHWRSMGGDAQQGELGIMYDGGRIINEKFINNTSSYDPMRKQGAILLGNGGDNSNASQGTIYEAAMTAAGTFPSEETNQKIQANIVAAKYDVPRVSIAPASATDMPPGLQTFSPGSTQNTTITFTNTTGVPVEDLTLSISVPSGWKSVAVSSKETSKKFANPIAPGASVSATFTVTSGSESYNGDIVGEASWTNSVSGNKQSDIAIEKVRNVSPVKINEFRIHDGSNTTNSFIELYNTSDDDIDISNWSLTQHATLLPIFSSINIPAGTEIAAKGFYLLGLSNSGLAVPAQEGESTIYVRSAIGMSVGDEIEIGTGSTKETRTIASITTPEELQDMSQNTRRRGTSGLTTVWQPMPDGPVVTFPAGSNSISVSSVDGFEVGMKMAIGYGATYPVVNKHIEKYEVVTITEVGKPGTQAFLSLDAKAGDTNIKVSSTENISVGDKIRLDIESVGHGIEWVTVKRVGTPSERSTFNGPLGPDEDLGTGLDLEEPLKFDHASNLPFSAWGTGISFEPASAFDHSSNEPVLALGNVITLDGALSNNYDIDAVVIDKKVITAGYQGTQEPDQWFGGPALSFDGSSMVLRDDGGNVVDGLNYGRIVDPWLAEGYHGVSGAGERGCFVTIPGGSTSRNYTPATSSDLSAGRYPDGDDNDSNCKDFMSQSTSSLTISADAGSNVIHVSSVADFINGQKIVIGTGADSETNIIVSIGTAGGTIVVTDTRAGSTSIAVDGLQGFSIGQTITIGSGANSEEAVIASIVERPRRRRSQPESNQRDMIIVSVPLTNTYSEGAQITGSGIHLSLPLAKGHDNGTNIASNIPTPGKPNQF
ncbi:MAG TPA: arabinofuranosidase catalytic domain-containing protein [Draconibacterium sp.]|nr:arabinofuranosidase catalytic domain-containing protein [Draconibacterium sp.]